MRRSLLVLTTVLLASAGCASSSDATRRSICGTWIGSPADGVDLSPWYLDVSAGAPSTPVKAYVDTARPPQTLSIINLRTTTDCAHGASLRTDGPALLSVRTEVAAHDGHVVVALITPRRTGSTSLVVTRPGRPPARVPFVVGAASSTAAPSA